MDAFEIAIYSLHIFSLNASFIVARAIIIILFTLIIGLILRCFKLRHRGLILLGTALISTIVLFSVSPPDNFTSAYDPEENLQCDLFEELTMKPEFEPYHLNEGKKIVAILSTGCDYCQMTAQKLSLMQRFNKFPEDKVFFIFMGTEEGVERFFEDKLTTQYNHIYYDEDEDVISLVKTTSGAFPVVVLLQDGKVMGEYGFRNLREQEVRDFMKANESDSRPR